MRSTSIIVSFDEIENKLKFFRCDDVEIKKINTTFITENTIDQLKALPLEKTCHMIGENLLIFMERTRTLLIEEKIKK